MKVWEKMLLYPIGLCYWIVDQAKKTGKFVERKTKPAIAMLVAVTMMLSLMPITAFAVSVPSGYTTDENGIMAYAYLPSGNFDIRGYLDGEWKSTTFGNGGYYTYLKQGEYTQSVSASSSAEGGFKMDNLNISIDLAFTNEGQTMQILYTVKNIGSQTENFSLGTGADIKIGNDDHAVITPFDDDSGYKMVSDEADDYDSDNGEYAQFNFFATGYKGVTDVSDYWYGAYYSTSSSTGAYWSGNKEAAVFCGNDVSESGTFDSAASWHWANQTLPAGETATYSVLIGIGGADSEDAAESSTHKHCVCGGTGAAGDHTSCEDITWTEWDGTTDITYTDGTAYVYLSADVSLSDALVVRANQTLYLCLNDHVLDYNGNKASGAITVRDGGVLYLTDCCTAPTTRYGQWIEENKVYTISTSRPDSGSFDTLTGGVITGGGYSANLSSQTYYGGGVWVYNGTFYMYGGTIAGNTAAGTGGGVHVDDAVDGEYGIFYMYDGTITGNRAANGGGIDVFEGTFYMYGGTIAGNTATGSTGGGGVYVSESEFHMSGGSITDNRATANGGGVVLSYSNKSKFNMSGGSITGNSADKNGGGVYAPSSAYITVSGAPKIINNTKGTGDSAPANNLVPESYLRFTVSGTLGTGASIGIFRTAAGRFSAGGADSVSYFSSDNAAYKVATDGSNLKLVALHTHNYTYSATGNIITESCTCGHEETATVSGPTGTIVYDGTEKKGATVSYSTGWLGGTLTVTYQNNINAGQATASITKAGATASVKFTIDKAASGNTLPTGLTATYGETLADVILPAGWTWNTPSQSVGDVGQKTFAAVYTPTNSNYKTVEADLMVTVGKATLTPENFLVLLSEDWSVALPASVTYNGNRRGVTVNRAPDGYTNSGTITVKYYDSNGTLLTSSPRDVGTYTIKLDITEGRCYKAATDLTSPDWTLTIGLASATLTPPTANDLTYNGGDQSLVSVGTAIGGELEYALGTDDTTAPVTGWSGALPQGQNAGTYYIWYKVVGDENHNNVAPACVAVTIAKKQIAKPAADNSTFTYNGNYQTYALSGDPAFTIYNNMQKNAGSYTVTATLQDTANYEWTDGTNAVLEYTFKIEQKEIGISWSNTTFTYNGAAQQPTATATGVVAGEQIALVLGAPETNAGSYTATVHSIDGAMAQNYKLPTNKSTSFTIEQQALTILWGNGTFTYDSTEKFPAFNVEGIWNADDVQVTKEGAQTNAGEYTAQITGLTGSDAGNYKLTGTLTKAFVINKADQAAPVVNKVDETISGKNDGKITDVTANMEYRAEGEDRYTAITGEEVENLADGKYYVRVKGDSNHNPSADTAVVIGAGRMLTVTVPQNQVGYTMTVDKSTAAYGEAVKVTFALNDGYSAADGFAVKLNGSAITLSNGEYTVANTTEDLAFTVEGVADITAPLAQIDIKNNKWTSFWNGVTFGLFFNETQDVTVTAADTGSGVNAIQYYLASGELELEEVKRIPVWQDYNATFQIDPDNAYVVYVKVTDNAGNVSYLNSDGVVLDQTVPVLVGIENNESYYGDKRFRALDDYLDDLKVDGVDVTDEMNGDNEYTIVADNAEHIVTVTDKAGNVAEYRITVYKNYTVTYKVDGNTISTQTVGHGKDATAPSIPAKDGYTQTAPAWDKDGKNITADTEINAVYTINKYTVTYKADGNVVGTVEVEHGKDATAPVIPTKEGYTQTAPAWDKDGTSITADTEINAVYTINKYTVTYKADGETVSAVEVEHGKDATAPVIPTKEGYTQTAPVWDKDGKNITEDTEINAVYTVNEYTITFVDENGTYKTVTVKHGESVEMPETPTKDGYHVTWETTIDKATGDATIKAVYTETSSSSSGEAESPQTGDNSNLWLWIALAFVSGGLLFGTLYIKKKEEN